ncbi:hypothetical protein [Nostoc phage YongM]|nr:hypothetical protein [Nostoc phage YongM]
MTPPGVTLKYYTKLKTMRKLFLNSDGNVEANYDLNIIGGLNKYYSFDNGVMDIATGTTFTAGFIRYFPIYVPRPVLIDSAIMSVSTLLAGGTFRIGLYENTVISNEFKPGNRIADLGEQNLATTGAKTFSFTSFVLNPGYKYVAVGASGGTGFTGVVSKATMFNQLGVAGFQSNSDMCLTETFTYASMVNGELPLIANATGRDTRYMLSLFRVIGLP